MVRIISFFTITFGWWISLVHTKFELKLEKVENNYIWSCSTKADPFKACISFIPNNFSRLNTTIVAGQMYGYKKRVYTGGCPSTQEILPPVFDMRWRDFKTYDSRKKKVKLVYEKLENIKLLHISVLFDAVPRITINDVNSINLSLKNKTSELLWRHYTIYKIKNKFKIVENLTDYNQDFELFTIESLRWQNADLLWKIHEYNVCTVNKKARKIFEYQEDKKPFRQSNHNFTLFAYCKKECTINCTLSKNNLYVHSKIFRLGYSKNWHQLTVLSDLSMLTINSSYTLEITANEDVIIDNEFKMISKMDELRVIAETKEIVDCQLIVSNQKIYGKEAIKMINTNCSTVICNDESKCYCNNAEKMTSASKSVSTSITILIIAVCIIIALLCLSGIFFIYRHIKRKSIANNLNKSHTLLSELTPNIVPFNTFNTTITKETIKDFLSNERSINEITKQYKDVVTTFDYTTNVGNLECNKMKNRYKSILPYDNCRVKLNSIDYINASYIQGTDGPKTYIATQCPRYNSVNDFWQMIWQEKTNIIVCLASEFEGKDRFIKYWPDDNVSQDYRNITVKSSSIKLYTDFLIRSLYISQGGTQKRKIYLFQYISWPDHSIPLFPLSLLTFLQYIINTVATGPIVTHCSAGIGRSGTYIMCDHFLRNSTILNLQKYLEQIRENRSNLVSKISQYYLVYFIIDEHINGLERSFTLEEFMNLENNSSKYSNIDTIVDCASKDFEYISERKYSDGIISYINLQDDDESTFDLNSLNYVKLNGYEGKGSYINTKYPSPNKFEKFWNLIASKQIKTVICITSTEIKHTKFWPTEDNILQVTDYLNVKLTQMINEEVYNIYLVKIGNSRTGVDLETTIYYYKEWNISTKLPKDTHSFNSFLTNISQTGKISLLCCIDGSEGCGVFLTYDLVNQKLIHDKIFDIRWAIRSIKPFNRNFIKSLAQIIFIYELFQYKLRLGCNEEYTNLLN